jgi:endonuclease YncB( thermonuclease family)
MNVDFPVFLAALTVFAIVVAWLAASAITRLQTRKEPTAPSAPTISRPPAPFTGRVWVVDGDTVKVGKHRVRLFGMDAPEMDQRGGAKAKSNLIRLAGGAEVRVEPLTMDCYGRVVAKV